MARNKGTFAFAANFEVKLQGLLDPRGGVTTKSELINKETFPYDGDTIYMKEGMLVTVSETQEVYMLVSLANILAEDYSGWKRIDAGAAEPVEVVDTLDSTDATKALSANQGRALKEEIDAVSGKLTSIYTYKASVADFAALEAITDKAVGDVYNVEAANGNIPAGTNYAWNGTEWDALGGSVDLSAYATTTKVEELIKVETDRATAKESELEASIGSNTVLAQSALDKANANETTLNSVTQSVGEINLILNGDDEVENDGVLERLATVETKNEAQDTRLTNLEKLVSGGEAGDGGETLLEMVNANAEAITKLQQTDTALETRVKANEDALAIVNGDASVEGSVDYKIEQAFKWTEVTA